MSPFDRLIALALQLSPNRPDAVGGLMISAMGILLSDLPKEDAIATFQAYAAAAVDAANLKDITT